jgi:hypothetical protein
VPLGPSPDEDRCFATAIDEVAAAAKIAAATSLGFDSIKTWLASTEVRSCANEVAVSRTS